MVENVVPYYEPLIKPKLLHRHAFWSNFTITDIKLKPLGTCKVMKEREFLQEKFGFNMDKYIGVNKRLLLRNCVVPELAKHVFDCAFRTQQKLLLGESNETL